MLFVKLIIFVLLGFVLVSLFSGLYFLIKDKGQTNRTVNALTFRIGLSVLAIVVVLIAGSLGVLQTRPNPAFEPSVAGQGDDAAAAQPPAATE